MTPEKDETAPRLTCNKCGRIAADWVHLPSAAGMQFPGCHRFDPAPAPGPGASEGKACVHTFLPEYVRPPEVEFCLYCGASRVIPAPVPLPVGAEGATGFRPETLRELIASDVLLKNLLAVIHRDGGHYIAAHGLAQATEDAMDLVLAERTDTKPPVGAEGKGGQERGRYEVLNHHPCHDPNCGRRP